MPVITINIERFSKLLGSRVSVKELEDRLPWLGLDIEDIGEDYIKIEYNPNRPDLGSPAGIVRAYKGIYYGDIGYINYPVNNTNLEIYVDERVRDVRPHIVSAIVKNVDMNESTLLEIINLQEDLHQGLGRGRRTVSIGIHNYDVIRFPVYYRVVDRSYSFIPLNEYREMTIEEILNKHPTGIKYSNILKDVPFYPIIIDNNGNALSFPPIINAEYTRVTEETKNLFIDVTATDLKRGMQVLNILVTTLAEYGGKIQSVKINYTDKKVITPDLTPQIMKYNVREFSKYISRIIGKKLSADDIRNALLRCRLGVELNGEIIEIKVPPYRIDILHKVDFAEEVAIGIGFWRIKPKLPKTYSIGKALKRSERINFIIDTLTGLGFIEVINYILTNPEDQFIRMNLPIEGMIEVEAPKSMEYRALRVWIIPQLLKNLYISKKEDYPHRLFEIGEVFPKIQVQERTHLGLVISHSKAGYTDIKAIFDHLNRVLDLNMKIKGSDHPSFIKGRAGKIIRDSNEIGILGEIHPIVLENFNLDMPVVAMEIDLTNILS